MDPVAYLRLMAPRSHPATKVATVSPTVARFRLQDHWLSAVLILGTVCSMSALGSARDHRSGLGVTVDDVAKRPSTTVPRTDDVLRPAP